MHSDGLIEHLQEFGLSEKEAAIFEAVLDLGQAKPSEIASTANVSTRYAYEVGERLEQRGILTVMDHVTPTVIRARSPEEIIAKFESELTDLKPALQTRYDAPGDPASEVEVIKTCATLRKRLKEAIESAQQEIALCVPEPVLSQLIDHLREAKERGVFIMLVVEDQTELGSVDDVADIIRVDPHQSTALIVIDQTSTIVMEKSMLTKANGDEWALASYDQRLSQLIVNGFDSSVWHIAEEAFVTDPAPLPSTFSHFRTALLHAALHAEEGTTLHLEATGHFAHTDGSPITITGAIEGVDQLLVNTSSRTSPVEQSIRVKTDDGLVNIIGNTARNGSFIPDTLTLYKE